jgi:copper chaperone CopZ
MYKGVARCLAVTALLAAAANLAAQAPPAATKVILTELHCMGCARGIAKKVVTVTGVSEVRADVKAKTLFIVHRPGQSPSPRGLWEAIEQANHTPQRMETPANSYTSKPPS